MGRIGTAAALLLALLTAPPGPAQDATEPPEPGVASLGVGLSVDSWRRAWEMRDAALFCEHYSVTFPDREAFCARKAGIFARNTRIDVEISDLQVGPEGSGYLATFLQDYRSDTLSDYGRKRLIWMWEGGSWKIALEQWNELPRPEGHAPSQWEIVDPDGGWPGVRVRKEGVTPRRDAPGAAAGQAAPAATGPPAPAGEGAPRREGVRPSGQPARSGEPAVLRRVQLRDTGAGAFLVLHLDGEANVAATSEPADGVVRITLVPARDELTHLPAPSPGGLVRDLRVRGASDAGLVVVELYVGETPVEVHRAMHSEGQIIVRLTTP
jgi:hypothetical protein